MELPDEISGVVDVYPGQPRRYRIGHESGDLFEENDNFDGVTLTVEAMSIDDAQSILTGLSHGRHLPRAFCDVMAERWRQGFWEGFTSQHDDGHETGEMARAAACYALIGGSRDRESWRGETPRFWPWSPDWWKPTTPRRDLVKAGALIAAEIERLDRLAKHKESA